MEYSEDFEHELADLESVAVRLAAAKNHSDQYVATQRHFGTILDDLINTYSINCHRLTDHAETVARIYHTRDHENTASKHIATVREAFLAEVCDEYDQTY